MLLTEGKCKFFTLLKDVLIKPFSIDNYIVDWKFGAWNIQGRPLLAARP